MAALTVTAANVTRVDGSTVDGVGGATITAGQACYYDSASGKWKLAQDDGTAEEAGASGVGVALNGAADGQPIKIQTSGTYNAGATVTVGQVYCVADAAGDIVPYGDLASTDRVTILGVGTTAARILLQPLISGIQKP